MSTPGRTVVPEDGIASSGGSAFWEGGLFTIPPLSIIGMDGARGISQLVLYLVQMVLSSLSDTAISSLGLLLISSSFNQFLIVSNMISFFVSFYDAKQLADHHLLEPWG